MSLQAAGFDILAAYWENSGSVTLTTADRLTCLSLFMDLSVPWTPDLWEPRFKALLALIHSGTETVGIEQSLLKILRAWTEGIWIQGLYRICIVLWLWGRKEEKVGERND